MISILVPTRRRVANFIRLVSSIAETTEGNYEVLAYVDEDDRETASELERLCMGVPFRCHIGPRIVMSDIWNVLASLAKGDLLMMMGDDVVFRTIGWDKMVEQAFAECPDKILLVHGDDFSERGKQFATLPIIHRKWFETVGYFSPPTSYNFADSWPNDIADILGRRRFVPFVVEHLHPAWGKAPMDDTYREAQENGKKDRTSEVYLDRLPQRLADAEKLLKVMRGD